MKPFAVVANTPLALIATVISGALIFITQPAVTLAATPTVDPTGTAAMATIIAELAKTATPSSTPTPPVTHTPTDTHTPTPVPTVAATRRVNVVATAVAATLTVQARANQNVAATQTAEFHQLETLVAIRLGGILTLTPVPVSTNTSTPINTPTHSPAPPPTFTRAPETVELEMILIPAGEFVMGSSDAEIQLVVQECNQTEGNCRADWFDNEQPQRRVFLPDFRISKYEVTNAQYNVCVAQGVCPKIGRLPQDGDIPYRAEFFSPHYPAVAVSWDNAALFCRWLGARLPRDEEWEKAARGADDARRYPWGATFDGSRANLSSGQPTAVGSYPGGASPYGVMDMAGNVFEWTATATGDGRYFVRGGGWSKYYFRGRVTDRGTKLAPSFVNYDIGFRCAR